MNIDPFIAGILITLFTEMAIVILIVFLAVLISYVNSHKTSRNAPNSTRSDENE